jgi:tRNA-dihydrouridine synthase
MNTDNIPKSFWHSLSASVLIFTIGFTWISYQSGNLTLKYKDFEIITASATKEIAEAKTVLEARLTASTSEIQALKAAKENAERSLAEAKRKLDDVQAVMLARGATESVNQIAALKEQLKAGATKTEDLEKETEPQLRLDQFKQVQQKLDNLDAIQKQIKEQSVRKA